MAKKRTKASKKKANQRRAGVAVSVSDSGEFSLSGASNVSKTSAKTSKTPKTPAVSKSRIMQGLDIFQIGRDLRKTLLVTLVVVAVLLVIVFVPLSSLLNYF